VRNAAQELLDEPEYAGLNYEGISNEFDFVGYAAGAEYEVEIIVGVEEGTNVPPDLAERLHDRLTEETGIDITVRVAFLSEQVAE
jgi:hypothetical protein